MSLWRVNLDSIKKRALCQPSLSSPCAPFCPYDPLQVANCCPPCPFGRFSVMAFGSPPYPSPSKSDAPPLMSLIPLASQMANSNAEH